MSKSIPSVAFLACLSGLFASPGSASAAGVTVGSSSLISALHYSDTFTVGGAARPDGLYNNNAGGGYNAESTYSNPAVTWTPQSNFSFNSGGGSTCCGYPGNTGSAGSSASSGLAQSGGGDFNISYGLGNHYIVQADAILPADRFDIGSYDSAGSSIFTANSLSVFFRRSGVANPGGGFYPEIGIYNGSLESNTGFTSGIVSGDTSWHNYAVEFNRAGNSVSFYVDQVFRGSLDLTTFAGGVYQNYSTNAVGMGGAGGVFWADNFQVGGAVPEPSASVLGLAAAAMGLRRRRKAE